VRGGKERLPSLHTFSGEISGLVARCLPAIALIQVDVTDGTSSGTGFVVDGVGHVVTNFHVVEGAGSTAQVQFPGVDVLEATIVAADPLTDLAVLRTSAGGPGPLAIRTTPPILGEICLTIGNPLDYEESVSMGIVSGLARTIPTERARPLERAIQTDAAINSGNSGGPLVDLNGSVLGVSTCVDTRGSQLGFAVPGSTVDWVLRQVMTYGDIVRGALGVAIAHRATVVGRQLRQAPVVTAAPPGSALRPDDVILSLNGRPVPDRAELSYLLTRDMIGTTAHVGVLRDGRISAYETPVSLYQVPGAVYR
jgi:S1-C subfamily serine protease